VGDFSGRKIRVPHLWEGFPGKKFGPHICGETFLAKNSLPASVGDFAGEKIGVLHLWEDFPAKKMAPYICGETFLAKNSLPASVGRLSWRKIRAPHLWEGFPRKKMSGNFCIGRSGLPESGASEVGGFPGPDRVPRHLAEDFSGANVSTRLYRRLFGPKNRAPPSMGRFFFEKNQRKQRRIAPAFALLRRDKKK